MVTTTNEIDAVLELKIKGIDALQKLENDHGLKIREIRCDNANENFGLKKEYTKNKMLRNVLWVEADNITIDLDNFFVNRGINYHHARCSQELRRKDTTKI